MKKGIEYWAKRQQIMKEYAGLPTRDKVANGIDSLDELEETLRKECTAYSQCMR